MSKPSTDDNRNIDDAVDIASAAASNVAGKISGKLDEAARTASRFSDKLRSNREQLHEELSAAGERFGDGAKRLGAITSEQVRNHPLAAIGIAAAVGFLVSRLIQRR